VILFRTLKELLGFKKEYSLCMVVSEQEGAEIWVDGRRTAFQTPRLVAIPQNREVAIELRHPGHENHRAYVKSGHKLSFYHCDLKRIPLRLVADEDFTSNQKTHSAPFEFSRLS
jgi:hypothetical protein